MAVVLWRGDAPAVAQVSTATITGYDAATTYSVIINGKSVSTVGTGGSVTTTAVALLALLQASTIPEFLEVTWTNPSGAIITGTALTAGVPFTATSDDSGGTGVFGAFSTTTTSSGPNDWSVALNWSGAAVPVNSDDVYIGNNIPIYYGLAQSAVNLTSLTFLETFSSDVGLPLLNPSGYSEYRPTRLAIGAATITTYSTSGRIRLDPGSHTTTINGYNTGSASDTAAFDTTGSGSTYTLNLLKGSYAVAIEPSQTATLGTVRIGYISNVGGDVTLILGSGCTTTTVNQEGGVLTMYAGATTLTMIGGTATTIGAGAFTTMTVQGGSTVYHRSTGTITTLNVYPGATADFSLDLRARTVTNCTVYSGGSLIDPEKTVTFTNAFAVFKGSILSLGESYNLQRS